MIILILTTAMAAAGLDPEVPHCLTKLDSCCQNCLQRYQVCDWRHNSLPQDATCLRYSHLCMDQCQQSHTQPKQQKTDTKLPPADLNQQ